MKRRFVEQLNPTLWRTCRILGNRRRLKLLNAVLLRPGLSVLQIAAMLKMNPPVVSKYLRDLNARGLLSVERHAANVLYRVEANRSVPQASSLVAVLTGVFQHEKAPVDFIFSKVTAFTHPRRVAIAERLRQGPARFSDLRRELEISTPALQRHLRKLASRGFLQPNTDRGIHALIRTGSSLELALLKLIA